MDGLWRVHFNILDRPVSVERRMDSKDHLLPTTLIESGPKWTVQKGETRRSLKWTATGNFIFLDRPFFAFLTVHLHSLRPSSFIPLKRLFLFLETVLIHYLISYSLFLWTIQFRWPSTLSLLDRPVWFVTVQFHSFGPFSMTPMDRPLWPKTVHIGLDHFNSNGHSVLRLSSESMN